MINEEINFTTFAVAGSVGFAVKPDGSWRSVNAEMELEDGETLYITVPEWAIQMELDKIEYARISLIENEWRESEINLIANQLMAIEESEASVEDGGEPTPDLLPGTRSQWLAYRTKVRAWKEGNVNFPDYTKRPKQPT